MHFAGGRSPSHGAVDDPPAEEGAFGSSDVVSCFVMLSLTLAVLCSIGCVHLAAFSSARAKTSALDPGHGLLGRGGALRCRLHALSCCILGRRQRCESSDSGRRRRCSPWPCEREV